MPLIIQDRPEYKGKLVRVSLGKGRYVKISEEEAIARGLIAPRNEGAKKEEPVHNKARRQAPNKTRKPAEE